MKELSIIKRAQASQNQISPQNRNQNQNQNFRRNQPPNRPREDDQQITPPFHQNYVSEVEETIEQIEEDDINMLGVDNDDFEVHYIRKQGIYTPYDDKRAEDESYYQEMENVIIETPKEYDLRSKNNMETPKNKTSKSSTKNSPVSKPKNIKQKDKIVAVNYDKFKEKGIKINEK